MTAGWIKLKTPAFGIMQRNADSSFPTVSQLLGSQTAGAEQQTITGFPADGEVVLRTPRMTLTSNVGTLYVAAGWLGAASGTVHVSDVAPLRNV